MNCKLWVYQYKYGNIDYGFSTSTYELFGIEYYNGKAYSLARPIGGGNLRLLETNPGTGAEIVIVTYSAAMIDDYDLNTTSFDYQNGKFIVLASDLSGIVSLLGINVINGNIDYSYSWSDFADN